MKRRYNREFKVKACELVLTDGIKRSVVAEKLGINVVMLYRWIDEYQMLFDSKERIEESGKETLFENF